MLLLLTWLAIPAGGAARESAKTPDLTFPGGVVWQVSLTAAPAAPAALDADSAYVAVRDGHVTAISLVDGASRWVVQRKVDLAPALVGGLLIIVDGPHVVALDKATGQPRWDHALDAPAAVAPAGGGDIVIVGVAPGTVLGLSAATGAEAWSLELGSPLDAGPGIRGDRAYLPLKDGRVVAVALETGRQLWERRLGGAALEPLADDSHVFVGSTDNFLYSLSAKDGDVNWRWRTGADIVGPPVVDDRRVYFLSLDNVVRGLGRGNGVQQWKQALAWRPAAGPILVDGRLFVGGVSPEVRAYRTANGEPAGTVTVPGRLVGRPFVAPGNDDVPTKLIVLTGGGQLLAIGQTVEPPLVPFDFLPGTRLRVETMPGQPAGPGRRRGGVGGQ